MQNYKGLDETITWQKYLENVEEEKGRRLVISCGFSELDDYLEGFQTGELVTISGFTAMGKSLFMKSLIRSFGIEHVPTAIFSFEDPPARFLKKFLEENADYPIYLPASLKMGDMDWLEERILEAKAKYDVRIITVDHLHYLLGPGVKNENVSLVFGKIMRRLKRIAVDHNLCLIVVAHQKKAKDDEDEATLESIRDSGLISNESDSVIIVQRIPDKKVKKNEEPTYEMGYSLVKIEKARRTGIYRKRLTFQKNGDWLGPI